MVCGNFSAKRYRLSIEDIGIDADRCVDIRSNGDSAFMLIRKSSTDGRQIVVHYQNDKKTYSDNFPIDRSARSSIHDYGGGSFNVDKKANLYFIDAKDDQLYLYDIEKKLYPISNDSEKRFADIDIAPNSEMIVICGEKKIGKQKTYLYCFKLNKGKWNSYVLADKADFYASARISKDGKYLAWLEWAEGDMPWESASLMCAEITVNQNDDSVKLTNIKKLLQPPCFNPLWSNDNMLYVAHEKEEYAQIFCIDPKNGQGKPVTPTKYDAILPMWGLEMRNFCILDNNIIIAFLCKNEVNELLSIEKSQQDFIVTKIQNDFTDVELLCAIGNSFCAVVHRASSPPECCLMRLNEKKQIISKTIYPSPFKPRRIAITTPSPRIVQIDIDSYRCYGIYYPALSDKLSAKQQPPAVIMSFHGGPAGRAGRGFKPKIHYWQQQGLAFFDMDYFGSTGYGRSYRQRIYGNWGFSEARIAAGFAHHLIEQNLAAAGRIALYGSSAGGYSVLSTICNTSLFCGAVIAYGIADLARLYEVSGRFEKGYLLRLIGIDKALAHNVIMQKLGSVSPISRTSNISVATLFLQGSKDPIVPVEQSRSMVSRLRQENKLSYYFEFDGAAHGFKKREHILTALLAEHWFYHKMLDCQKPEEDFDLEKMQTVLSGH